MLRGSTRRGPCSDRACRLLVYRQAGKVTAKIAPRTRINVLQSTSVSELPKARIALCGHAPRTCVNVLQSTSASELPEAQIAPCGHAPRSVAGLAKSRGGR